MLEMAMVTNSLYEWFLKALWTTRVLGKGDFMKSYTDCILKPRASVG